MSSFASRAVRVALRSSRVGMKQSRPLSAFSARPSSTSNTVILRAFSSIPSTSTSKPSTEGVEMEEEVKPVTPEAETTGEKAEEKPTENVEEESESGEKKKKKKSKFWYYVSVILPLVGWNQHRRQVRSEAVEKAREEYVGVEPSEVMEILKIIDLDSQDMRGVIAECRRRFGARSHWNVEQLGHVMSEACHEQKGFKPWELLCLFRTCDIDSKDQIALQDVITAISQLVEDEVIETVEGEFNEEGEPVLQSYIDHTTKMDLAWGCHGGAGGR